MGFYQLQPVNSKETTATYLWTGLGTPGVFVLEVKGVAQQFTSGFDLVRDKEFVGGLKVNSMGWTGPLSGKPQPYTSKGSFPGQFRDTIFITGSNGTFPIKVKEVPHDQVDAHIQASAK